MSVESYGSYLTEDSAIKLRTEADNIITHDPLEQKTWWYSFNRPPQNIIEEFIFKSSRQHNTFESYIGAEWWIRTHNSKSSSWPFHIDADLGRHRKKEGYISAPFCSVTYLSDYGQPTVLVDRYHDWTIPTKDGFYITGDNMWTMWSAPKMGKHISWSLPYFHGVVRDYGDFPEGETRVTLMYNCWKGEKPYAPECIEYNLPYKISEGTVDILPIKDKLEFLIPHGFTTIVLEGEELALQYHGFNQKGKSWMVTQEAPAGVDTTPRFPKQEHH